MKKLFIFFICEFRVEQCEVLVEGAAELLELRELNSVSDIKRDIPKLGTVFTQTGATYDENT